VRAVLAFFALAVAIATAMVFWYTRCVRSTVLVVLASLVAVVWQLGLLPTLGYALDPYSILVPFLVFAIGMSHGAQKMNGIMQDVGRGLPKWVAARFTFRRLFLAGLTALLADAVGFAVLLVIDIQAIRELAIAASIGVAVLIFTNLILLPILLSYTGVSAKAAERSLRAEQADAAGQSKHPLWALLDHFTRRSWAAAAIAVALLLGGAGFAVSRHLAIGDLDPGAPELRAGSRYNRDVAFMNSAYGASSDVLAVMVKTPEGQCSRYETLNRVDALEWQLRQLDGVESTNTLALLNRRVLTGLNEGNPRWYEFLPNQDMLNTVTAGAPRGLYNDACSLLTVYVYLRDHRAETLTRVVEPRGGLRPRQRHGGHEVPARRRFGRHRGRHQHRGQGRLGDDAAAGLRGGGGTVLHHLPQLAGGGGGGAAAGADLLPGRGADGGAGHGREGGHAAGDRPGRGHRRGLCAVHPVGHAGAAARGQEPVGEPTTAPCCSPARW
jgi:predicted RND superfamily exporter protein